MEVLSFIISIIGIIIHIAQKADSGSSRTSYTSTSYQAPEFTAAEKLDNLNIDSLNICYKTGGIPNFSMENARRTLLNHFVQSDFLIDYIIVRQNCMYVKVKHSIPFNGGNKCYGAAFSVNYMTVNDGISVYGSQKLNADEVQVFKQISSELIKAIS